MKSCSYCGRENEDAAVQCRECGTEMQTPPISESDALPEFKNFFRQPHHIAWLAAFFVMAQAALRLSLSPFDPSLGEGNVERLDAATYLWKCAGIATVLVSLGLYLRSRRKG